MLQHLDVGHSDHANIGAGGQAGMGDLARLLVGGIVIPDAREDLELADGSDFERIAITELQIIPRWEGFDRRNLSIHMQIYRYQQRGLGHISGSCLYCRTSNHHLEEEL